MKIKNIFLSILAITALVAGGFALSGATNAGKPDNLPNNGNSHNKATGEVTWSARNGALPGIETEFNAHDLEPNSMDDKGTLYGYRPTDPGFEEGTITIDFVCVNVQEDQAWFAGTATEATGGYEGNVGDVYLYWVKDVATPGANADLIGGRPYDDINSACADVESGSWNGSGMVTDGNLVVHYSEPEPTPEAEPELEPLLVGGPEVQGLSHDNGDDHGKPEDTPNNGNSHEKATGDIMVETRDWVLDFNAHETDPAEGDILTYSDSVGREISLDVKAVRIEGSHAWFAAQATEDTANTLVGHWLFVRVYDGGTPGTEGDMAWWDWISGTNGADAMQRVDDMETPANHHPIVSGNLVVHSDELSAGEMVGADLSAYNIPDSNDCDVTVEDDENLQDEIDTADSGDTVCVEEGTYNEFVVDKPLTVAGLVSPESSATIVPSGPSVTELALVLYSHVTITGLHFDGSSQTMQGNQAAGIQISPNGGDIDNVEISYNLITDLNTAGAGTHSNKGIQWHDGASSGSPNVAHSLTNSTFMHNVIDGVHSENSGGYGIQTVGNTDNLTMEYNTISDISGRWGAGIALDSHEKETSVGNLITRNHIMDDIVATAYAAFAVQVEANADGGGVLINENNIDTLLYGGSSGVASPDTLNAENNWWGTTTPAVGTDIFVAPATNDVDFSPYALSAYPTN